MKLLIFKLFGLILLISMTFSKSSLKNYSSNANSNANTNSKFPPETIAYGYASNDNILQNAAVIIFTFTIIFQSF